jgi:hypothetical protein
MLKIAAKYTHSTKLVKKIFIINMLFFMLREIQCILQLHAATREQSLFVYIFGHNLGAKTERKKNKTLNFLLISF